MSKYDETYNYVRARNYALYRRVVETATIAVMDEVAAYRVERNIMSLVEDILKGMYDTEQHQRDMPSGRSKDNAWGY